MKEARRPFSEGEGEWEGRRLFKLMNASFLSLTLGE